MDYDTIRNQYDNHCLNHDKHCRKKDGTKCEYKDCDNCFEKFVEEITKIKSVK